MYDLYIKYAQYNNQYTYLLLLPEVSVNTSNIPDTTGSIHSSDHSTRMLPKDSSITSSSGFRGLFGTSTSKDLTSRKDKSKPESPMFSKFDGVSLASVLQSGSPVDPPRLTRHRPSAAGQMPIKRLPLQKTSEKDKPKSPKDEDCKVS